MSDDLKPCPFCGGEPEWVDIPDDKFSNTGGSVIECMSCGSSTHVEFGFKENLIDTWNRRAASRELVPAMADRIEELEAKLDHLSDKLELERALTDGAHRRAGKAEAKLAKAVGAARELMDAFYSSGNATERHHRACQAGVKLEATLTELTARKSGE